MGAVSRRKTAGRGVRVRRSFGAGDARLSRGGLAVLWAAPGPGALRHGLGLESRCHHWSVALVWPAEVIVIEPPHPHEHCDESSRAGTPPTVTAEEPGLQGLTTIGTHGCGVSTPWAAAVAEAT